MYQYRLSFSQAVKTCFSKFCTFKGRASRAEYWWFYLFTCIISWISMIPYFTSVIAGDISIGWLWFCYAIAFVLLLPTLGVTVRRLHDIGKGGGWIFISLIPLIGTIWLIVLLCQDSEPQTNRFGDVPYLRPIGQ